VHTSRGEIIAKSAIVTASIGVLQAGSIAFDPALTPAQQTALASLTMGSTIKIAAAFADTSASIRFGANSILLSRNEDQRGAEFLVRPFGAPLAVCTAGGSLALDLESRSARDHREFAIESLRALLGTQADRGLRGTVATSWGRNPLVLGSISAARPGGWSARETLQQPIAERVFLAGEAFGGKAVQTVHGAFYSGQTAARRVLSLLKRKG
jgi:monoamine oxidase